MKLIDSHCHLNYDFAPKTTSDLIAEGQAAGVAAFVTIATDIPTLGEIQKISETYDCVYHTIGVHPHDAASLVDSDLATLEAAVKHPKCRAIGEIGLDYHYDHSPREIQKARLEQQLDLALRSEKPVVIHSRDGEADLLVALKKYAAKQKGIPGVIHCFSGTQEFGTACVDLGFYLSFSGILTFKKADEIRALARYLPLDRLLIETDAPFLAPIPHRGKKCEPAMVRLTAEKLAEVKAVDIETVAEMTTANSCKLFGISLQ